MDRKIPFNKPYTSGRELEYMRMSIESGKIAGDGMFTRRCHEFFSAMYGAPTQLTTSCTDALEMAGILAGLQPGDEVIVPAYTFVSTANAFALRGAKVIFADSRPDHPGIDEATISGLVTRKTKAIVPVHYAGAACDMSAINALAKLHNLCVIEDAAQAIDSHYVDPDGASHRLGTLGDLAAFSFHETKNIVSGEGGMLVINDPTMTRRSEVIREKGTNRAAFFKGEVDKYSWVDIGSSFLPSDILAAFLFAQLESIDRIQARRKHIWQIYFDELSELQEQNLVRLPGTPAYATNNAHMFYLLLPDAAARDALTQFLRKNGVSAAFHYQALSSSPYYGSVHGPVHLPQAEYYTDCLLRLPMFCDLTDDDVRHVCGLVKDQVRHHSGKQKAMVALQRQEAALYLVSRERLQR